MESARCKAFLAAAETGSFTKAAEALNYTPSGVSQLVAAFEQELGFTLLRRHKTGVNLTANGEKILPAVKTFLQQENHIYQLAAEINGLLTGTITIASYFSVATHWLPRIIRLFQEQYPHVEIRLMEGVRQEIVKWLDNQLADVAFVSYREPMQYDWIPLAEDPMLAILPPTHPLAKGKSYPLKNCETERFIMPALAQDEDIIALFRDNQITPNVQFSTKENFSTIAMVEQGLGISIMNELITRNWEADVVKLPLTPPQWLTLGIALPSLNHATPAVKQFVKFATQQLTQINKNFAK